MGAALRGLDELTDAGSFTGKLGEMQHRSELYELIDYEGYNHFDTSIFNFTVAPLTPPRAPSATRASPPARPGTPPPRATWPASAPRRWARTPQKWRRAAARAVVTPRGGCAERMAHRGR